MKRECIAVYMMANMKKGTLYIGVTSDLRKRIFEHKEGETDGFTKRYGLKMLVYYELHEEMSQAIHREKRLKKYTRDAKLKLVEKINPSWNDLWEKIAVA